MNMPPYALPPYASLLPIITSTTPFLPPNLPSLLDSRGTIWEHLKIDTQIQSIALVWCLIECMYISMTTSENKQNSNQPTCTHGHESAMRMRSVFVLSQHCVYNTPSVFSLGFPGQDLLGDKGICRSHKLVSVDWRCCLERVPGMQTMFHTGI